MIKKVTNSPYSIIAVLIALLLPFFLIAAYINPSADDYSYSHMIIAWGPAKFQEFVYMKWMGRYAGTFLICFNPLVFGSFIGYKLFAVVLLLMFVFSVFVLIRNVFKQILRPVELLLATLLVVLVYLNVIPNPSETIYWMTGSLFYFFPTSLICLVVACVLKFERRDGRMTLYYVCVILLSLVIIGCNEVDMIFIVSLCIAMLVYRIHAANSFGPYLWLLLVMIAFSVVEIVAPGNYLRMTNFPDAHNFSYGIREAGISSLKLLLIFIKDPSFILLSLLSIPLLSGLSEKFKIKKIVHPAIAGLVFMVFFLAIFFPVSYSTGLPSPLRIYNSAAIPFMIIWFFTIYYIISFFEWKIVWSPLINKLLLAAMIIAFAGGFYKVPGGRIIYTANVAAAAGQLVTEAPAYNKMMEERYHIIRSSKDTAIVPEITVKPSVIHFLDIDSTASSWENIAMAQYFNVKAIVVKGR